MDTNEIREIDDMNYMNDRQPGNMTNGREEDKDGIAQHIADDLAQELADRREENAALYGQYPRNASPKQLDYIRLLCKEGWLTRGDFPSSQKFFRKGKLTIAEADRLIQLAKSRRQDDRKWRNYARCQGW